MNDPNVGDVKKVYLEVGELRYVVPDILELCFANSVKSDKLSNAAIEMEVLPVEVKCSGCGKKSVVKMREFKCRHCSETKVEVLSGTEFNLKGIEW